MFSINDVAELSAKMFRLATDETYRNLLANLSQKRAQKFCFDWDSKILTLFDVKFQVSGSRAIARNCFGMYGKICLTGSSAASLSAKSPAAGLAASEAAKACLFCPDNQSFDAAATLVTAAWKCRFSKELHAQAELFQPEQLFQVVKTPACPFPAGLNPCLTGWIIFNKV